MRSILRVGKPWSEHLSPPLDVLNAFRFHIGSRGCQGRLIMTPYRQPSTSHVGVLTHFGSFESFDGLPQARHTTLGLIFDGSDRCANEFRHGRSHDGVFAGKLRGIGFGATQQFRGSFWTLMNGCQRASRPRAQTVAASVHKLPFPIPCPCPWRRSGMEPTVSARMSAPCREPRRWPLLR